MVHSDIEIRSRCHTIYTPSQWYDIIRQARRSKKNPFIVIEADRSISLILKIWLDSKTDGKTRLGENFTLSKIRKIYCTYCNPCIFQYKLNFSNFPTKNY